METSSTSNAIDLVIRPNFATYTVGFSNGKYNRTVEWLKSFPSSNLPPGFDGAMFGLFASGNGYPWPFDAPEVGFSKIREEYYNDDLPDYIQ